MRNHPAFYIRQQPYKGRLRSGGLQPSPILFFGFGFDLTTRFIRARLRFTFRFFAISPS
jgi:hypothetical protein